jgi:hypothetical protein
MQNRSRDSSGAWRHIATVEIGQDVPDFDALVGDPAIRFRAEASETSPAGYQWFEFYVDENAGDRACARTAWALLTSLERLHANGELHDFRIIHGKQWLALGESNASMGVDGMTPGNDAQGGKG